MENVHWSMGDGAKIKVGLYALMSMVGKHSLPVIILNQIHKKEIYHLNQVIHYRPNQLDLQEWYKAEELELPLECIG